MYYILAFLVLVPYVCVNIYIYIKVVIIIFDDLFFAYTVNRRFLPPLGGLLDPPLPASRCNDDASLIMNT